jgi:hypothetical protein
MIACQENSQDNKSWRHGLKWQNKVLSSNPSITRKQEQKGSSEKIHYFMENISAYDTSKSKSNT